MTEINKGSKLCDLCFDKRERKATQIHTEHVLTKNWAFYFIPFICYPYTISKALKRFQYPDGYVYHIYINGIHEQWSKHKKGNDDLKKCNECNEFKNIYYELETNENSNSIFNYV